MSNKTEFRTVTPEEKLHIARQQRVSFPFPFFDFDEQDIREKIARGEYDSANTYGAVDESGRVLAGMDTLPFNMWFDGQKISVYGISGVVSLPESRRQGNIRGMFSAAFRDMHEKGVVFSHLFPFSFDYYRKFGYEHCGFANKYTLPLSAARRLPADGTAHEFIQGDGVQGELVEVYEKYASRHNLMVSRTEERWKGVFNVSLFSHERLYYYRDTAGVIQSWVKFVRADEKMMISDIAWANHEGMLGALKLVGMYEGAAEKLMLRASPELVAELYWNDPYQISSEPAWHGMSRVINAAEALRLIHKPSGEGGFTVKLTDSFCEWNSGTYAVTYGGSQSVVTRSDAVHADLETDERAFVQLVMGVYELGRLVKKGDVRVNGNLETLERVFVEKPRLLMEIF